MGLYLDFMNGTYGVTILVHSSPRRMMGLNLNFTNGFPSLSNVVLCAKASMLLQVCMRLWFISLVCCAFHFIWHKFVVLCIFLVVVHLSMLFKYVGYMSHSQWNAALQVYNNI